MRGQKALEIALQKTAAEADGAEDVVGDELPVYGFQAAKHDKAAAAGVEIQSKKSKKTDKSLRDYFQTWFSHPEMIQSQITRDEYVEYDQVSVR